MRRARRLRPGRRLRSRDIRADGRRAYHCLGTLGIASLFCDRIFSTADNYRHWEVSDAGYRDIVCAMQRDLSVHGKGAGKFLSAEYDGAAAVPKMPVQKSGNWRERTRTVRDRLRQLRKARYRSISAEGRTLRDVPRVFRIEPLKGKGRKLALLCDDHTRSHSLLRR